MFARALIIAEMGGNCRDWGRSRDDAAAANPAIALLTLRWTFSPNGACVVVASLPRQRPVPPRGLGGGGAMLRRHE
jgi:hypothetical protein